MMSRSATHSARCPMPEPCGELSSIVVELLSGDPCDQTPGPPVERVVPRSAGVDLLDDLDMQRAWFVLAELDGHGVCGVDDRWNEHPAVATLRRSMGDALAEAIRDRVGPVAGCSAAGLPDRVRAELDSLDAPSLAGHLAVDGTVEQYRDFLRHRSIYHLREADPHTTAIPRLTGRAKAGLVEIQSDEYGAGRVERMHSTLFAGTLRALGLSADYAAYAADLPAVTLAWSNALTLFASRRQWRAAVVGHLLALECTSSIPNKKYSQGLSRLGYGDGATRFFDEHVEADAVHEQIAMHDMAVPLLVEEPDLSVDLLIGFRAALMLDADVGRHLLRSWAV
ncbi:iron-containing redox enzyme family protein [Gordonia sp. NPDC003585]|uniref:iron-containing redox enzyme family protein n=1 Tax=Gordonia sp. NPDC003585 TaxID=3154275 RepID=UPI0033BA6A9E